jgi:hypothetical protein
MSDDNVIVNDSAISSVMAALANKSPERTASETEYDRRIGACVIKPEGHTQKPLPKELACRYRADKRLYTVTTIASSARYGGKRTPVICDSFDAAQEIVLKNMGDIWEYSYMFVVIEARVANHIYGGINDEHYWYVWVGDQDGGYQAIETPPEYANTCGFGIG